MQRLRTPQDEAGGTLRHVSRAGDLRARQMAIASRRNASDLKPTESVGKVASGKNTEARDSACRTARKRRIMKEIRWRQAPHGQYGTR